MSSRKHWRLGWLISLTRVLWCVSALGMGVVVAGFSLLLIRGVEDDDPYQRLIDLFGNPSILLGLPALVLSVVLFVLLSVNYRRMGLTRLPWWRALLAWLVPVANVVLTSVVYRTLRRTEKRSGPSAMHFFWGLFLAGLIVFAIFASRDFAEDDHVLLTVVFCCILTMWSGAAFAMQSALGQLRLPSRRAPMNFSHVGMFLLLPAIGVGFSFATLAPVDEQPNYGSLAYEADGCFEATMDLYSSDYLVDVLLAEHAGELPEPAMRTVARAAEACDTPGGIRDQFLEAMADEFAEEFDRSGFLQCADQRYRGQAWEDLYVSLNLGQKGTALTLSTYCFQISSEPHAEALDAVRQLAPPNMERLDGDLNILVDETADSRILAMPSLNGGTLTVALGYREGDIAAQFDLRPLLMRWLAGDAAAADGDIRLVADVVFGEFTRQETVGLYRICGAVFSDGDRGYFVVPLSTGCEQIPLWELSEEN